MTIISVAGFIDTHVHTGPAPFRRIGDTIDVARWCSEAKMTAIVIKSHFEATVAKVYHARKEIPDLEVYAGIALNRGVGGINPAAREHRHAAGEHHLAGSDRHQDFRGAARRRIAEDNDGGGGYAVGPGLDCLSHRSVVTRAAQLAKRKGKRGLSGNFTLSDATKNAFTIWRRGNPRTGPFGTAHAYIHVSRSSLHGGANPRSPHPVPSERTKGPPGSPTGRALPVLEPVIARRSP